MQKKRCEMCRREKKDNKTTAVCDLCKVATCTKHFIRVCETCYTQKFIGDSESDTDFDEQPTPSTAERQRKRTRRISPIN